MKTDCTIELERIVKEFSLEALNMPEENILVSSTETSRPGLHLAGYYEFFDKKRIQILGMNEIGFLKSIDEDKRIKCIDEFFAKKPVAVIIARNLADDNIYSEKVERNTSATGTDQSRKSSIALSLSAFKNRLDVEMPTCIIAPYTRSERSVSVSPRISTVTRSPGRTWPSKISSERRSSIKRRMVRFKGRAPYSSL